jgi:hypothetical protein
MNPKRVAKGSGLLRLIEVGDDLSERTYGVINPTDCLAEAASRRLIHCARGQPLELQPGPEQILDYRIVKVPTDTLSILDDGDLLEPGAKAGRLHRNSRDRGKCLDDEPIVIIETSSFFSQVEVSKSVFTGADRHAEECSHRRMMLGKANRVRMIGYVTQEEGLPFPDQCAKDPVTLRQMPDSGSCFLIDPMMNELDQRLVLAHHAERSVPGSCYVACGLDQSAEQRLEIRHAYK